MGYFNFCDQIFARWYAEQLQVPPLTAELFQLEYSPEPYLHYGQHTDPIAFLTWNPGYGICFQRREYFDTPQSPFSAQVPYRDNAVRVGSRYAGPMSPIGNAANRVRQMLRYTKAWGANSAIHFDALPYHSRRMARIVRKFDQVMFVDKDLVEYTELLQKELSRYPLVIAISGPSRIEYPTLPVRHFAKLLGINYAGLKRRDFRTTGNSPSSYILWTSTPVGVRAITVVSASNILPSVDHLATIIAALRSG